jgi:hypothetical protein
MKRILIGKEGFLMITFLMFSLHALSQSISIAHDTITWNAASLTDQNTNVSEPTNCRFITYGNHRLEWIQGDGNYITSWSITGFGGDWADVAVPGTISCNLSNSENGLSITGQAIFKRSTSSLTIQLLINGASFSDINLSYNISSYEKQ